MKRKHYIYICKQYLISDLEYTTIKNCTFVIQFMDLKNIVTVVMHNGAMSIDLPPDMQCDLGEKLALKAQGLDRLIDTQNEKCGQIIEQANQIINSPNLTSGVLNARVYSCKVMCHTLDLVYKSNCLNG